MAETLNLPVLPLADEVVLPGMVAPVTLDGEAQAAVDAARSAADGKVILVPRIDGTYGAHGVVATVEQVGRLPNGEPAAVLRARRRAQIGTGVAGAGAALWVEVTVVDDTETTDTTKELASSYKSLAVSILQQRGAWQFVDSVQRISDPGLLADTAGYAPYISVEDKLWLLADDRRRCAAGEAARAWSRPRRGARGVGEDPRRRARRHGEEPARVPAAPAACRDPQGAG